MSQESLYTLPKVTVPSLDRLEVRVESPRPPSADELIERLYERLRSTALRRERGASEPIGLGDDVVCDLVVTVDGEVVPGGIRAQTTLEMRDYPLLPGLVEGLLGMRKGERKRLTVTLPQSYPVVLLAGREAELFVAVHRVQDVSQPSMEDPVALNASGLGGNLSEAMRLLTAEIDEEQGADLLVRATKAVLAEFGRRVRAEIEEELIDSELLRVWEEGYESALWETGFDEKAIDEAWLGYVNDPKLRDEVELRLKTDAGLKALVEREELLPNPKDMESLLEGAASALGLDVETARRTLHQEDDITTDLVRSATHLQAVEFLMARAVFHVVE